MATRIRDWCKDGSGKQKKEGVGRKRTCKQGDSKISSTCEQVEK